jgi:hypothetical protein
MGLRPAGVPEAGCSIAYAGRCVDVTYADTGANCMSRARGDVYDSGVAGRGKPP